MRATLFLLLRESKRFLYGITEEGMQTGGCGRKESVGAEQKWGVLKGSVEAGWKR